jgi:hypothetical protein
MMQTWVYGMVIAFIVRQIGKFGTDTKWGLVKKDLDVRVAAVVPGAYWDDEAVQGANAIVDAVAAALQDAADLQMIAEKIVAKDWAGALAALKVLVSKLPGGALIAKFF